MNCRMLLLAIVLIGTALQAEEPQGFDKTQMDRQLYDTLRDVHNRGRELYNKGDTVGCLRLFEGALELTRPALHYRPEEQKLIKEGLAKAAKIDSTGDRAFALHELIEDVRKRLVNREISKAKDTPKIKEENKSKEDAKPKVEVKPKEDSKSKDGPNLVVPKEEPKKKDPPKTLEMIPIIPRELLIPEKKDQSNKEPEKNSQGMLLSSKNSTTPEPMPTKKTPKKPVDPKLALTGKLYWQGNPLEGVDLMFVSRDAAKLKVYETTTLEEGRYALEGIPSGKYTVILNPVPSVNKTPLPSRYQTVTDSPLIFFISGPGDTLDFLLK